MQFHVLCCRIDRNLFNVVHMSLGFFILFTAYMTITNMQKTIYASIEEENPEFNVDAYLNLGLMYAVFAISLWLAPSIISVLGFKMCLLFGGSGYAFFIYAQMFEKVWLSYLSTIVAGVGCSLLWVAEGQYLVDNSDEKTMPRNIGVFWAIYSSSMIFGNIYAAAQFSGKEQIDIWTRKSLLFIMGTMIVGSVVLFAFLRKPYEKTCHKNEPPLEALRITWRLFCTKDMLVLFITFIYTGFQQSFGNGVYSPTLGFTKGFGGIAKLLVPLSGLVYGIGSASGGFFIMILSRIGIQKRFVVIFGFTLQAIAYASTFLNLPNSAVFGETDEASIITPSIWIALVCSLFYGIGESCLNTQIFPILRDLHPQHSAQTCSLYKFSKSVAVAISFVFSSYLGLHLQLLLIFVVGILGSLAFSYVELRLITSLEHSKTPSVSQTQNNVENKC